MADENAPRERFLVLDGLRGAAALAVITDHVYSPLLTTILPGRYLAVDFFFALSGFVLAHVYGRQFAAGLTPLGFMHARVARLYPLYIAATLFGALLAGLKIWRGWTDGSWTQWGATTLLNSLYLPTTPGLTTSGDQPFPFNGPAWSLFFELVVNLAFALIVLRLTKRLTAALLLVSALAVVWTAFTFGKLDSGFLFSNFLGGLARVFYAFFAGVLVYQLRDRWRLPGLPAWLAFVLLMAILAMPTSLALRPAWDAFAAIVLFPLLIAFSANSHVSGAAARACATAGLLSYGFYVFQAPVRDWLEIVMSGVELPGVARVALVGGVTVAIVVVLQRVYERPVRQFLVAGLAASPAGASQRIAGK